MRALRAFRTAVALGALLLPLGCPEGTPVSPAGSVIRISVSPTRITKSGTATVTLQVLRGNGNPVNSGTEVRLSTTIGTIDPVVYTNSDGVATATLHGDGRAGTATITAYSGSVDPVTADLAIGSAAASIRLQVTPTSVPETGGTLELLALVRDDQGEPLADAAVNFATDAGTLDSGGSFIVSDENGEARDLLTVTDVQLQAVGGDSFDVSVEVGGSAGVQTDTFSVGIQRPPRASFSFSVNGNTVAFTDTSTGSPTSWHWEFGDNNSSNQQNPVHQYGSPGTYTVVLTARNAVGESVASNLVTINQ